MRPNACARGHRVRVRCASASLLTWSFAALLSSSTSAERQLSHSLNALTLAERLGAHLEYAARLSLAQDLLTNGKDLLLMKSDALKATLKNPKAVTEVVFELLSQVPFSPEIKRLVVEKGLKLAAKRLPDGPSSGLVGLEYADVAPLVEIIDSLEEIKRAMADPSAFFDELIKTAGKCAGRVIKKLVLRLARPQLDKLLTNRLEVLGLEVKDVLPAFEALDTIEELQEALKNPLAFLDQFVPPNLSRETLLAGGRVAKRIVIANAKAPILGALSALKLSHLVLDDVRWALEECPVEELYMGLMSSIDGAGNTTGGPEAFLKRLLDAPRRAAGKATRRLLILKAKPMLLRALDQLQKSDRVDRLMRSVDGGQQLSSGRNSPVESERGGSPIPTADSPNPGPPPKKGWGGLFGRGAKKSLQTAGRGVIATNALQRSNALQARRAAGRAGGSVPTSCTRSRVPSPVPSEGAAGQQFAAAGVEGADAGGAVGAGAAIYPWAESGAAAGEGDGGAGVVAAGERLQRPSTPPPSGSPPPSPPGGGLSLRGLGGSASVPEEGAPLLQSQPSVRANSLGGAATSSRPGSAPPQWAATMGSAPPQPLRGLARLRAAGQAVMAQQQVVNAMQQATNEPKRPGLLKRASTAARLNGSVVPPLTFATTRRLEWEHLRAALDELTDADALRTAFGFGSPKSMLHRPKSIVGEFLQVLLNLSPEADAAEQEAAKRLVLPKLRTLFEERNGPLKRLHISWEDVLPALELAELPDLRAGLGSVQSVERLLTTLLTDSPAAVALAVAQHKPKLIKPMATLKLVIAAPIKPA